MLLGLRVVLGMSGGVEKKFGYIIDWSRGPWMMGYVFRRMVKLSVENFKFATGKKRKMHLP